MTEENRNILKEPWRKFALRAQNLKRTNDNPALIRLTVVVNSAGIPIFWVEPRVISIEPRLSFDFKSIEKQLSPEQLATLLEAIIHET